MNPRRSRCPTGDERGQAAVELALALPLLGVLALGLVQVVQLGRDAVAVTHAAREAAREAAVTGGDRPRRFAAAAAPLDRDRLRVQVVARPAAGGLAEVRVAYRAPTDVPLVGRLLPDVTISTTARSRVEM